MSSMSPSAPRGVCLRKNTFESDVHPRRREEDPPDHRYRDRPQYEDGEDVNRPGEDRAPCAGKVEARYAIREQVHRADRDNEKAPEDKRVREPANVVRALKQFALAEIDDELVAEAQPGMVEPRLGPAKPQESVEAPGAPEERAKSEDGQGEKNRATWDKSAGWRGHSLRISSAMTSFMISLVPS